jgi:penicillin-binding protein 1C
MRLANNGIHNLSVLVADARTHQVLAYVGNVPCDQADQGCAIDAARIPRSTGSLLKPLLLAAMLQSGEVLPDMLIPDVPTAFGSYVPKNFFPEFAGAIPAKTAVARSLNVPSVLMLNEFGVGRFLKILQSCGLHSITHSAEYYGLSLILGGAEATLWEMVTAYTAIAHSLNDRSASDATFLRPLQLLLADSSARSQNLPIGKAAFWHTFQAMEEAARPDSESGWRYFLSSRKIAWKTGTSFGLRDGWAIGCTPEYVVGVWAGNMSGEGRPGLTGLGAAAPVLFDVFGALYDQQEARWFPVPAQMTSVQICAQSGYLKTPECPKGIQAQVPPAAKHAAACPYHKLVFLDHHRKHRVHADCYTPEKMQRDTFFVLPPVMEQYYKRKHPAYKSLPNWAAGCSDNSPSDMELIYPRQGSDIFIPTKLDGSRSKVVFRAVHRENGAAIYWHLNGTFVAKTFAPHEIALDPPEGAYQLVLTDSHGNSLSRQVTIRNSKADE